MDVVLSGCLWIDSHKVHTLDGFVLLYNLAYSCFISTLRFVCFFPRLRRPIGKMTVQEQKLEGEFRYVNSRLITNRSHFLDSVLIYLFINPSVKFNAACMTHWIVFFFVVRRLPSIKATKGKSWQSYQHSADLWASSWIPFVLLNTLKSRSILTFHHFVGRSSTLLHLLPFLNGIRWQHHRQMWVPNSDLECNSINFDLKTLAVH